MAKTKDEALLALQNPTTAYESTIAGHLERIEDAKTVIVDKVVELGLGTANDNIGEAALAINGIQFHNSNLVMEETRLTLPEGYYKGVAIELGDVSEAYELEAKTVTPTKAVQEIQPGEGKYGLSKVTVEAIPEAYQDVTGVTAGAYDVLVGKTIVDATGAVITGAMPQRNTVDTTLTPTNASFSGKEGHYGNDAHDPEFEAIKVDVATTTETMTYVHGGTNKITATDAFITEVTINPIADAVVSHSGPDANGLIDLSVTPGYISSIEDIQLKKAEKTQDATSLTITSGWLAEDAVFNVDAGTIGAITLDKATGTVTVDVTKAGYVTEASEPEALVLDAQAKVEGKSSDTGRTFTETVTIGQGYNAEEYDITFSHTAQAGSVELGLPVDGVITPVVTEGYVTEVAPLTLGVSNFSMGEGASLTGDDLVEGDKWTVSHSITAGSTVGYNAEADEATKTVSVELNKAALTVGDIVINGVTESEGKFVGSNKVSVSVSEGYTKGDSKEVNASIELAASEHTRTLAADGTTLDASILASGADGLVDGTTVVTCTVTEGYTTGSTTTVSLDGSLFARLAAI